MKMNIEKLREIGERVTGLKFRRMEIVTDCVTVQFKLFFADGYIQQSFSFGLLSQPYDSEAWEFVEADFSRSWKNALRRREKAQTVQTTTDGHG